MFFKPYYGIIKSATYDQDGKNSLQKLRKDHLL